MTAQVRNKIVNIINAWIRENGNMPLRLLKTTLRSNGISDELLGNIQPKLWITNEFPEFNVLGTNGYEQIVHSDQILQILIDAVSNEGKYLFSNVPSLLSPKGIDWKHYANGKKIYEWISDSYPRVFKISDDRLWFSMAGSAVPGLDQATRNNVLGTNGYEQIVHSDQILQILIDAVSNEGKYLFSNVPSLLSPKGIDWKHYANGKKIYEWISDSYPGVFKISDDRLWFSMAGSAVPGLDQATRNFVYQFCFFPANASLLRLVKELTGDDSFSQTKWASQRTFALVQCLLGLNGGILDDSNSETPRLAFHTGLKTPCDQDIYGVLAQNTNEGASQKWIFSTVTFPGQDTEEGYWLCNTFGIKSQASYGGDRAKSIAIVSDAMNTILEAQQKITCSQTSIQSYFGEGRVLPDLVAKFVLEYINGWHQLKAGIEKLEIDRIDDFDTIYSIQQFLDELNNTNRVQEELMQKFTALVHSAWNFMRENMLCSEDHSDDDIDSFGQLLRKNITEETVSQLENLLDPFRAVAVLRSFDPSKRGVLEDAEYDAIDSVNEHFGSHLKIAQLKHSICDKEIDMDFLGLLPEINAYIMQIKYKHNGSQKDIHHPTSDAELLSAALDGTLWFGANKVFRKPNSLERAIMLGDVVTIRKVLNNQEEPNSFGYEPTYEQQIIEAFKNAQFTRTITPLHAAERLIQVMGRSSELVDQCLLLSIMQKEPTAPVALMQHYIETDRPELAYVVFCKVKEEISDDVRREILLTLVRLNCISVTEAITDDVLAFLTDVGVQLTKSVSRDEILKARLLEIYEKIQVTLIHHVVFLSPELQGYILRPENASELVEFCSDKNADALSDLLRQNTYEHGNSPLQVAKRIHSFVGNWGDLALDFVRLSTDSPQRREFEFDLLCEKGDDISLLQFLNEYPDVKQVRFSCFFDILYKNKMYPEICEIVREQEHLLTTKQIIQAFLALIKTGEVIEYLPEFDSNEVVNDNSLLCEISNELSEYDQKLFRKFWVRVFPNAVQLLNEEELTSLVTVGGTLSEDKLYAMARETSSCCPALAVFYGSILNADEFVTLRDSYLDERYNALSALNPIEQKRVAHELGILNPEKYSALEENIFDVQLSEILERDISAEEKTAIIIDLLGNSVLGDNALHNAIVRIGQDAVLCHAPLYSTLCSMIKNDSSLTEYLKCSYGFWNQGDEEYKIFICTQMMVAIKRNLIPDEYLVRFEECILEMSSSLDKKDVSICVLLIEKNRNREPYLSFISNLAKETSRAGNLESVANEEMSLFCDAIEDESVDTNEYFQYCSRLTVSTEQTYDSDVTLENADVLKVLRRLYQDPQIADNWDAAERLIPQSRIRARGIALHSFAHYLGNFNTEDTWRIEKSNEQWTVGKTNIAWERCVNYCMAEDQDDLFFKAIRSWLQQINGYYVQQLPWYSTKHYMQTLQKLLEDSDTTLLGDYAPISSFPACPKGIAVSLITEAVEVFKRIEQNKTNQVSGDDNHNALRVIVELGLRLDCEDLLLKLLSEELAGAYVNLGLVVVCRLLLTNKINIAMHFLHHIVDSSVKDYNYSFLIDSLASMSTEEELFHWMSVESNRATLRFILPNGNAPDILRLQTLVMSSFGESNRDNCVQVVENLIDCYPRDAMSFKALFIICKEDYTDHLPQIYRALVGIFKNYHSKPRNMYTRDRIHVLSLIEILRQVMEQLEEFDVEYESTTDLIRGYYHENDRKTPDELVSMLNQVSDEIKSLFIGIDKNSNDFLLLTRSLLGSVTENWTPFFREAFRLRVSNWVRTYFVDKYKSSRGMLRGVLRVWQECPSDAERDEFISWINEELEREKDSLFSKFAMKQLNNLVTKINFRAVNWNMLRLPWEEHLVCLGNLKDLNRSEKNCCYKIMMTERLKGQSAKDSFVVMIRIAQDNLKAQLLYGNARDWFRKGDYDLAGAAYEALAITRIVPTKDRIGADELVESYETWMRISYVFAGVDMSSRNCSQHSCMNMICALINAGYVKYFDRLRIFFTGINLKLFNAVRKVLATPLNEEDTLGMLSDFQRPQERPALIAFLHFILSQDHTGRYLFISNRQEIENVARRLSAQESTQSNYRQKKYWISLQIRPLPSVFPLVDEQETEYVSTSPMISPVTDSNDEDFLPRYCSELDSFATNDDGYDLQTLIEEYHKLTPYSDSDCSKRLRLSALICIRSRSNTGIESEKNLVTFGINYYKYHYNRIRNNIDVDVSSERIHSTMLDLAIYGLKTPSVNAEIILSLPNWLQYCIRGFSSMNQLLKDYAQNRVSYASILKLLSDTEYSDAANCLFEVLNTLLSTINRLGKNALDIRSYQVAQSRLSEVTPTRDWVEMFSALNEMLRQSINKLDQRPSLKVTLFNAGVGLLNDGLYGEVENTGRETAYRPELQVTFPNNNRQPMSSFYRLPSLSPNEKAAFSVSYKASESLTELEYILNLSYSDKEIRCSSEPLSGHLAIVPSSVSTQTTPPQFNTTIASSFQIDEDGNIFSKDFKGRKSEIQKLSNLLSGDDFSNYHSAIVQGVKRSGKTSLLNYLRTFIRAKKQDNVVHLFVDCQALANKPLIYKAFFKSVLDELPLEYPQILNHPSWAEFNSRWRLNEANTDRDPADLSLFFRQLHSMMGDKGLYLIFDEFDALIRGLESDMGYDALLQSLRSLQMNPDCLKSVHMVLCGSNHLLIYNQTGSFFNQMFQSYETIPVGQMLASDIQEMITDWLEQYPFIRFAASESNGTSPSIQWIERYTGGLVWYTRLLVNEAVRMVLADKRDCVYPSDICNAFNSICNYHNCRQLVEGCDSNDQIVLDAMQSLSVRPGMYISYESLMQLLEPFMNAEQVRRSLTRLTESVELLKQKSPSIRSYRFRIELYRRYFRTHAWLDNHASRFSIDGDHQVGGDCFTIVETDSNIETVDSNSEFNFI